MSARIVFVFGSNLAGRHGAGAAYYAMKNFGAVYGEGRGRTGNAYALPTKDENLQTLDFEDIEKYVDEFLEYARANDSTMFILTAVGTGLAGIDINYMTFLFSNLPENVYISGKMWNALVEHAA